ncbi:MAG: choice-of-anchor D domain-containing protein [Bacteroidota bacterium]
MTQINRYRLLTSVVIMTVLFVMSALGQNARDLVKGNLIQFNDNGAWCWYQDERAVVDIAGDKIILGSDASRSGVGGSLREGNIDAVMFDLQTGLIQRYILKEGGGSVFYCDDHNVPAFLVRPDGKYLAMYTGHNNNNLTFYRIFDGNIWSTEQVFDWSTQPGGTDFATTYSNIHYLPSENRTYNLARGNGHGGQNLMISSNLGDTWSYGGFLTNNANIGYVNGYFKYCDNSVDRIDFTCTEYHPRDYNTSIYHGYIKNGQTFKSDGTLVDSTIFDKVPTTPQSYTPVFITGTVVNGMTMTRCWNIDVQRYADSTIAALIKARVNDNPSSPSQDPDHCYLYCRYDGQSWTYTYLGKAGKKLYSSEQDYTGLGALCPNDPNTIYISTPYDPRNDSDLIVHEIYKGVTSDHGATWTWTPVTQKSVRDNLRPIVPAWDANNTALLWWRGTYTAAQSYNAAIVGILDRPTETLSKMTYVDATTANTILATGAPLTTTGPDTSAGPADNQWHQRTGRGNGGSVFTSSEVNRENAPMLKTQVTIPVTGVYDMWVNFWGNPTKSTDWRIKAGLDTSHMQIFRQMACKEVENGDHESTLDLSGSDNTFLYQAYVGRVQVLANNTFDVFVDDDTIRTGTLIPPTGSVRTWYDGVSYAIVNGSSTAPVFTLSAPEINFGTIRNDSIKKDSVLVSNPGNDTLRITAISSTNARFTFAPATMTLAPLGSAYMIVTFAPQDTLTQSGSIIFIHNAVGSPDTLAVNGKGSAVPVPVFSLSGTAINFTTVSIGSTKKDSVLVSNPGTDTLKVTAISSTNTRFTFAPATMILAPLGSTYLIVTFTPQDTSSQSGLIIFTHNALGSPDTLSVSGKGSAVVAVEHDKTQIPTEYVLNQNYPNPFNPSTEIRFAVPVVSHASLVVYDILGREVAALVNGNIEAGYYTAIWNASSMSGGIYFAKFTANDEAGKLKYSKVNKMLLMK